MIKECIDFFDDIAQLVENVDEFVMAVDRFGIYNMIMRRVIYCPMCCTWHENNTFCQINER